MKIYRTDTDREAVPPASSSHRAPASTWRRPLWRWLMAVCLSAAGLGTGLANPVGPTVISGQAAFSQQGNLLSIANSPNAIIDWSSFSINSGEITRFIQQGSNSSVLNRITGQDPSRILGALQSNGRVFLINPNGILFGNDAQINVGGLVASSLAISNADFLAGKNRFAAGEIAGKVSNSGAITTPSGGQVLLIAPDVGNSGIITSPQGEVVLAAGRSVQLADSANPGLHVVVSAPSDQALNLGQVIAQGGKIGIYGALINQRGTLNADSAVAGVNGTILLKASRTTLLEAGSVTAATGAGTGGTIELLGQQVGLTGDARVDASGQNGGGTVLVGGGYQGKNASVMNAQQVYVGPDARISADAIQHGDGGTVIVWGQQTAQAYGALSVRGGALSGNGGLVETSGHFLDAAGLRVDASAANGRYGKWLLDPYDIYVTQESGGDPLSDAAAFAANPERTSYISASLISGATANVTLQAERDIYIRSAIDIAAAGVGLTAQAGNNFNIEASITTQGGALVLSANVNGGGTASGVGKVNFLMNAVLTTNGGALTIHDVDRLVLSSIQSCIANPAAAGCSSVLPTLSQCFGNPSLMGCSVVLPSLSQCTANPSLAACSVVLPTLSQCGVNPSLKGCSAVLPPLGQCAVNPSVTGCWAVLPTLSQCVVAPFMMGCSSVLPPLSQCMANPSLAGCSVVLPTLRACAGNPNMPGCSIVLLPHQNDPAQPLSETLNSTVNLINKVNATSPITASAPDANTGNSTGPTAAGADDKEPAAKTDKNLPDALASKDSGVKNDVSKKMYCN
jgi:filamentous hemagglutinin family protein